MRLVYDSVSGRSPAARMRRHSANAAAGLLLAIAAAMSVLKDTVFGPAPPACMRCNTHAAPCATASSVLSESVEESRVTPGAGSLPVLQHLGRAPQKLNWESENLTVSLG